MSAIPAIIHLISATSEPPARYAECLHEMRKHHPHWRIRIWDDVAAVRLVEEFFPDWLPHYLGYEKNVQRTDILRVMLVYLYGGFYLDMDIFCLRPLDDLLNEELVLGVEKILPQQECEQLGHRYPLRIANYMFGSRPLHAFWPDFLAAALDRAGEAITCESDVLETTGPGLLTDVYHKHAEKYQELKLLHNASHPCPVACGPASCHFGDYARHLHFGAWRWQTVGDLEKNEVR